MYNSPIEMITKKMRLQQEDHVFKAVQEVGIIVDKDELIKALEYDRDQYDKGYRDGMIAASLIENDIREGIFAQLDKCIVDGLAQDYGSRYFELTHLIGCLKQKYTEEKKDENKN